MSFAARPAASVPRREATFEAVLIRRASGDLVELAQELLLLEPTFDRAFPRERTCAHAHGIECALRRLLTNDLSITGLLRPLRKELQSLNSPPSRHPRLPSLRVRLRIADELLRLASTLQPASARVHVVRAQKAWVFGTCIDDAQHGFERAYECASTPASAAMALLHLAILRADHGFMAEAVDLLSVGAQLHPRSLAVAWTLAVYALATGRRRLFEQQLPTITRTADAPSLRRRGLALCGHMDALARSGVLPATSARARTVELLSRLPPIYAVRNRS